VIAENDSLEPIIPALIPDMLTGETRLTDPSFANYLTKVMQGAGVPAGRGGAIALAERPDFTDMLTQIEVPTLVIVGVEDALYPVQTSRDMVSAIPNATLAILPGGSHAAVFEAAGNAVAAISAWGQTVQ
jgi:pimeloyl-ACP methyl ester carboxylesterase